MVYLHAVRLSSNDFQEMRYSQINGIKSRKITEENLRLTAVDPSRLATRLARAACRVMSWNLPAEVEIPLTGC